MTGSLPPPAPRRGSLPPKQPFLAVGSESGLGKAHLWSSSWLSGHGQHWHCLSVAPSQARPGSGDPHTYIVSHSCCHTHVDVSKATRRGRGRRRDGQIVLTSPGSFAKAPAPEYNPETLTNVTACVRQNPQTQLPEADVTCCTQSRRAWSSRW